MCDKARKSGITGVPVTIIDGRWTVNGGLSSDVFIQVLSRYSSLSAQRANLIFLYQIFKKLAESKDHTGSLSSESVGDLCA